jgi:hypothetical protein
MGKKHVSGIKGKLTLNVLPGHAPGPNGVALHSLQTSIPIHLIVEIDGVLKCHVFISWRTSWLL